MLKLKAHSKIFNQFTEIDKFLLIPKKLNDEFEIGEMRVKLNDQKVTVRIYDIPCDCNKTKHTHRLLDLRDTWDRLRLKPNQPVEITK